MTQHGAAEKTTPKLAAAQELPTATSIPSMDCAQLSITAEFD